ncbi:MAG: FHA domain-containing protein [Halobacteriovoraceae bacterium]|jgi:pSer/pThr/pTyr-binding forkhead associated (FHA) protein|nr:FHA domain-containing protein [Halobacteriovoraceae bacterium]MBT5092776.1 FHA domain-containing protein [Halobacteriovoraceae bacterium]
MAADKNIKISKNFTPPEAPGGYHRLLTLTGKSKGLCYYILGKRIVLGRGETADIQVLDTKSSREHAEIKRIGHDFFVTDLGSQNGVVVNDLKVTQHKLVDGDKFIIGQTVFKYSMLRIQDTAVVATDDDDDLEEYEDDEDEEEEEQKDDSKKGKKGKKKGKKDNKKLIYIVVVIVLAMMMMGDDSGPKKKKSKRGKAPGISDDSGEFKGLGDKKIKAEEKEVREKLEAIIHRGQREFRERNFFRAIEEFELALILSPNNGRASFYLGKTKQRLNDEIDTNFTKAKRDVESLKFSSAIISYCNIIKLLQDYSDDERYKAAEKNLGIIEADMGLDKGEVKCF